MSIKCLWFYSILLVDGKSPGVRSSIQSKALAAHTAQSDEHARCCVMHILLGSGNVV